MTSAHNAFISCIVYLDVALEEAMVQFIEKLNAYLVENFSAYEIILVNDSGCAFSQNSLAILDEHCKRSILLLELAYQHGLERAMLAGQDLAVGDFIIEFDYPESSLPPSCLGAVLDFAQTRGVDIVGGVSRQCRPTMSRLFYKLLNWLQVTQMPLATEVIRLVSRRAINRTITDRRNIRYRKLLYSQSGFRYEQVDLGDIKMKMAPEKSYRLTLGLDLVASSSRLGSSSAAVIALFFLVLSMSVGIYSFIVWLIGLPVSGGWTTIMGLLSIGLCGIFAVLSLIARMLSIVLDEVQHADPYKVREVVRLGNK